MKIIPILILSLGMMSVAAQASASDAYLRHQASELEALSHEIARELRYSGEHRALRREAEELAREASRFRDAVDGRHERVYIQTRYDTLSRHYHSLDRHYRRVHFEPRYRHLNSSFISITTIFGGLDSGYVRYSSSWDRPRYTRDPVIIYRSSPRYEPFGIQHRSHRNDRHHDRHSSRHRDHHDDRGRRNHYK